MAEAAVIRDFFVALGFKTNESDAKKMQDTLITTEEKAKLLHKTLLGLTVGTIVAVTKTAKELDKLYYSSQRIGASASNIQAYGSAIAQLGGDAESAVASLESVAEKIRNAPGYESMIQGLGVVTRNQDGQIRDRVEVLKDLSKALSGMPHYQANAYAQSLGVDEKTLLAMRNGSFLANMEKYQKLRKDLGMTDDLAKSGADFMVEARDLGTSLKGVTEVLVMTIGKALIPILKLINQGILGTIHWFNELDPTLKKVFSTGLKFLTLAMVFRAFLSAISMLRTGLSILTMFIPVLRGLSLAFLASPFGWVTGLIIGLAGALALLYDDFKVWKEGGKSFFDWSQALSFIKPIGVVFESIKGWIKTALGWFGKLDRGTQDLLGTWVKFGGIGLILSKLLGRFKVFEFAKGLISKFGNTLKWLLKLFAFTPLERAIALVGLLAAGIRSLINDFEKWKSGEASLIDWPKWLKGIDKIIQKIKEFIDLLKSLKDKVINFVHKIIADPVGAIKELGEKAKEIIVDIVKSEPTQKILDAGKALLNDVTQSEIGQQGIQLWNDISDPINGYIKDFAKSNAVKYFMDAGSNALSLGEATVTMVGEGFQKIPLSRPAEAAPVINKESLPKNKKALAAWAEMQHVPSSTAVVSKNSTQIPLKRAKVEKPNAGASQNVANGTNQWLNYLTDFRAGVNKSVNKVLTPQNDIPYIKLGNIIAAGEGNYNSVNRGLKLKTGKNYGSYETDLSKLTINEILERNKLPFGDKNRMNAVGKLQIIAKTMELVKDGMGLTGNEKFTPELQERIFREYFIPNIKELNDYVNGGKSSLEDTQYALSKVWASVPVPKGRKTQTKRISDGNVTYYDSNGGNKAKKGQGEAIRKALIEIRNSEINKNQKLQGDPNSSNNWNFDPILNLAPSIITNPDKMQINSSMLTRNVTIQQNFKTDMIINGARDPEASGLAVKRSQDNAQTILAHNATNVLI